MVREFDELKVIPLFVCVHAFSIVKSGLLQP